MSGRASQSAWHFEMVPFGNQGPGSAWCLAHWLGISGRATVPANDWESLMRVDKVVIKLIEELYEDLHRWEAV